MCSVSLLQLCETRKYGITYIYQLSQLALRRQRTVACMSCGRYLETGIRVLCYTHDTVLHVANCCWTYDASNELFN